MKGLAGPHVLPIPREAGAASPSLPVASLCHLLALPLDRINSLDIALVNLLCAKGLPGSERLTIRACLATLDKWTDAVRRYTCDNAACYERDPAAYDYHEGFSKLVSMAVLLKRGIGVRYQPAAIGNYVFADSRDDLLHGLLTRRLGTCTSLPVLCVAIGRRLGYPMHLAIAKGHVLCQWVNDDGSHLNFEVSGNEGDCSTFDDAHYHNWPRPMTAMDVASGRYLRPLTRPEELALFLETRDHCLVDNRCFDEARRAYAAAFRAAPQWSEFDNHVYSLDLHEAKAVGREQWSQFSPIMCIPGLTH